MTEPDHPIHLSGRFALPESGLSDWRRRLHQYAAAVRAEPGCIEFKLFEDRDRPGSFVTMEAFDGEMGLQAHSSATHTQAIIEALHEAGATPQITFLTPVTA